MANEMKGEMKADVDAMKDEMKTTKDAMKGLWLLTVFGVRQAARTIHFVACFSFVGFIVIHILRVIFTGFFNNIRSMVTGWFIVKHAGVSHEA